MGLLLNDSKRIKLLEDDLERIITAGIWSREGGWKYAMQRLAREGTTHHLLKLKVVDKTAYDNGEQIVERIRLAIEVELRELKGQS